MYLGICSKSWKSHGKIIEFCRCWKVGTLHTKMHHHGLMCLLYYHCTLHIILSFCTLCFLFSIEDSSKGPFTLSFFICISDCTCISGIMGTIDFNATLQIKRWQTSKKTGSQCEWTRRMHFVQVPSSPCTFLQHSVDTLYKLHNLC